MSAPLPSLNVRILGRDYALEAAAEAHPRLAEAARRLDAGMRAHQAQDPVADTAQLAVLAALDLFRAAPSMSALHEREIARGLAALQRKLDRLDAALVAPEPAASSDKK